MTKLLFLNLDFSLPFQNPVFIFSLILFIILLSPLILKKFRVPHVVGYIIAGVIIGPYGFNILLRDSSIILFGTVGLLYIMFLAGLEIDLQDFKKNRTKSIGFGIYTFSVPMIIGTLISYYYFNYPLNSSILLASMFASHTLIAYPITSRFGVTKTRSVNIAVGGTIITDTLALLVLAVIAGSAKGEVSNSFYFELGFSMLVAGSIIIWVFPVVSRWFFKRVNDNISQYIFVLALVFFAAFFSQLAGMEPIIGAFLAGLALNKLVPRTSPLMNRIEFVGNALFIPFFLIGVGMLVDLSVLSKGDEALKIAIGMTIIAMVGKYLAAYFAQKSFGLTSTERTMLFGLSNAQAAATLAAVLIGYNLILGTDADGQPIRLLHENVLNGSIVMILVTCLVSSMAVSNASSKLALQNEKESKEETIITGHKILIPLANPETIDSLIEMAILLKNPRNKETIVALNIVDQHGNIQEKANEGKKLLEMAVKAASATDNTVETLIRHDINITNGINFTINEQGITDVIIGLHRKSHFMDSFLGSMTDALLNNGRRTIYIYKSVQPIATIKRIITVVPENAEYEPGFGHWFDRLNNLSSESGLELHFYAMPNTKNKIKDLAVSKKANTNSFFHPFESWNDFNLLNNEVKRNDFLVIITARKMTLSYQSLFEKLPSQVSEYFSENSFMIVYPKQTGTFTMTNSATGLPIIDGI